MTAPAVGFIPEMAGGVVSLDPPPPGLANGEGTASASAA